MLAGGCSGGIQDLIRQLPGVMATSVGYTVGDVSNTTCRHHGTHAEGVDIVIGPENDRIPPTVDVLFLDPWQ